MARSTSPSMAVSDAPVDRASGRSVASNLLRSLRPGQWTKNLLVFAALLFGRRLEDPTSIARSLLAFAVFCGLSGVVYLVNDVADRDSDRKHPLKALRPIASGALAVPTALLAAASIALVSMAAAAVLGG